MRILSLLADGVLRSLLADGDEGDEQAYEQRTALGCFVDSYNDWIGLGRVDAPTGDAAP